MPSTQAMTNDPRAQVPQALAEKVLLGGDLSVLTPTERLSYYNAVCASVGLNPLTRPFEYLALNGKLTLYARKDCTDQLRDLPGNEISVELVGREIIDGVYVVTARAKNLLGRTDESIGAVPVPASPTDRANAMMKAETKAKRRVTLSICGLGVLDETEIETIDGAHMVPTPRSEQPPATVLEPQTADVLREMHEAENRPQQASDAPVHQTAQDYITKANLSQSIREVSHVGNEAETDKELSREDLQTVRKLVKQRIGELGKK
jgi:hypothetical protein